MTPEEALRHAYSADLARLPEPYRNQFAVDRLVQDHLAGKPNGMFHEFLQKGHPSFHAETDEDRALQDSMLEGYRTQGWTPSEVDSLRREPQPYEYSSGGRILQGIDNRKNLYDATGPAKPEERWWLTEMFGGPEAWTGGSPEDKKVGAAKLYADEVGKTHAYFPGTGPGTYIPGVPDEGMMMFNNPESSIGTLATKMGGALSMGWSQAGTAALRGNGLKEKALGVANALPNAAVRSQGADWNRTSPQLAHEPKDWREADQMIQRNRAAWQVSDGMSAGDTSRQMLEPIMTALGGESLKGQIPIIQPFINGGLSFLNGMGDGSGALSATKLAPSIVKPLATGVARAGIPGVSKFAASTADDIAKYAKARPTWGSRIKDQVQDEYFDPGNMAGLASELLKPADTRSKATFDRDMALDDDNRAWGLRQLEGDQNQIKRPAPYGIEGGIRRVFGNLIQ